MELVSTMRQPVRPASGGNGRGGSRGLDDVLDAVARGDNAAFERLYDQVAAAVFGVVRHVVQDHAQTEEVAQEVFVEVWRTAPRFDPARGSAVSWILTIAHRRAVDRVRAAQAAANRDDRVAQRQHLAAYDDVVEQVEARLERDEVRHCLAALTALQRQSVSLAYYRGYTYREVAELLDVPLGTIKTRLRDGLLRLRSCLGEAR